MADDLVASGRFVQIRSRGRRTGSWRGVTVGFAQVTGDPADTVRVAAGTTETAWALNLLADPACEVTIGDRSFMARAEPLDGADHAATVRALILRYGTPAEGLGRGPSFRLVPVTPLGPTQPRQGAG